ncbi:hypothetical protein ACN47E_005608 [Coniothyrium glycines]
MGQSLSNLSWGQLVLSGIAAYFIYALTVAFYNVFLHPLSKYPGPKLRAAFYFPGHYETLRGVIHLNWHKLHEEYGEIVRVNPNTLSVIRPDAWREIYGHGSKALFVKDPQFYPRRGKSEPVDIIAADDADHARLRRSLNHAFSETALREQEPIIKSYITLMIEKLQERALSNEPVDIMKWLNFTTFDITGDLAFDESFDTLKNGEYNDWIASILGMFWATSILRTLRGYPIVGVPVMALLQFIPGLAAARWRLSTYTHEKVTRRLASKTTRKDFMSYILANSHDIPINDLKQTSGTLIVAGSETSATLLSGAIYYLATHPHWLTSLQHDLDTAFPTDSHITFDTVKPLKRLTAILTETFRLYPPVPTSLPRVVNPSGATLSGAVLPAGTQLGVAQYAMYRSSRHFTDPATFHPERFLDAAHYATDKRHVIQPFSVGPRNCIGQSLAWAELRTILARLVWRFDIQLEDGEAAKWDAQKVHVMWQKTGLVVRLKERRRGEMGQGL